MEKEFLKCQKKLKKLNEQQKVLDQKKEECKEEYLKNLEKWKNRDIE